MTLTVNNEPVDEGLLQQEFGTIKAHYERMGRTSCCERDDEFRGYARDNIISRVLLAQEARQRVGSVAPEEIETAVAELKKEHGGEELFYLNLGITPADEPFVRENVRTSLAVDKLLLEVCGPAREPEATELEQFYQAHLADYTSIEEVRASHIFKSLRQVENREAIFRGFCQVRQQLLDGANFDAMARQHSDKPPEDIDLGFFKRGELMDEFEIVAFSMRVGEISPVFVTQNDNLHIATVTDRKPPVVRPLEEVRDDVRRAWLEEQRAARVRAYVQELRGKARIEETADPA